MPISKRELRFARIAVKNRLVSETDIKSCIKLAIKRQKRGQDKPLSEILVEQKLLSPRDVKSIVNAQAFKEQRVWDKLYGRIAIKNRFATLRQVDECLAIQKKRYLSGKDFPRLAELLLHKGYLTRSENRAIRTALAEQNIEDHFPSAEDLYERLFGGRGPAKKKPKPPPGSKARRSRSSSRRAAAARPRPAAEEVVEAAEVVEAEEVVEGRAREGFLPAPPELDDPSELGFYPAIESAAGDDDSEASESGDPLPDLDELAEGLRRPRARPASEAKSEPLPPLDELADELNEETGEHAIIADESGRQPLPSLRDLKRGLGDEVSEDEGEEEDEEEDEAEDDEEDALEEAGDDEETVRSVDHRSQKTVSLPAEEEEWDGEETVLDGDWDGEETSLDGFAALADVDMNDLAKRFDEAIARRERAEGPTRLGLPPIDPQELPPPVPAANVFSDESDFSIGPGTDLAALGIMPAPDSDARTLDAQEEEELEEVYELLFDGDDPPLPEVVDTGAPTTVEAGASNEDETWRGPASDDTWGQAHVLCPRCEVPFQPSDAVCEYCGYIVRGGADLTETLPPESRSEDLVDTRREVDTRSVEEGRFDELGLIAEEGPVQVLRLEDRWLGGPCLAVRVIGSFTSRVIDNFRALNHRARLAGDILFLELLEVVVQRDALLALYEHCDGGQLSQKLERDGAIGEDDASAILRMLARGYAALHRSDVLAGEPSPQTSFYTRGNAVRLLGLGMSQLLPEIDETTLPGAELHLAPERSGGAPTKASDVYALGSFFSTLLDRPDRPEVVALLDKTLAPDPDKRFANAEVMDNFLKRILPGPHVCSRRFEHCGSCWNQLASTDAEHCESCGATLEVPCLACARKVRRGSALCHHCDADLIALRNDYRAKVVAAYREAGMLLARDDHGGARKTLLALSLPEHPDFATLSEQIAMAVGSWG